MSTGKIAAMAGHAYCGALLQALSQTPDVAHAYASEQPGTKVALVASTLPKLIQAHAQIQDLGLPSLLVVDQGCLNFFGGKPIVTALGIGPVLALSQFE